MKLRLFLALASVIACASAPASLVAWYPLDEGTGNVANDASGNGNFMQGNPAWLGTGAFGGSIQVSPGATLLARTGSSGSLAGINATTGNKVTILAWIKPNTENIGESPFWISGSNSGAEPRIFSTHLEWYNGNTYWDAAHGGSYNRVVGDLGTVADALHHYAFTYNGDSGLMEVYKDGVATISGTGLTQAALPWGSIQNFEIGATSFSAFWPGGQLDDFAIFNEVLSPTQINQARTSGVAALAVPEPATTAMAGFALAGLLVLRRRR